MVAQIYVPRAIHPMEWELIRDGKGKRLAGWLSGRATIADNEETKFDLMGRAICISEAVRKHERAA